MFSTGEYESASTGTYISARCYRPVFFRGNDAPKENLRQHLNINIGEPVDIETLFYSTAMLAKLGEQLRLAGEVKHVND